MFSGNSRFKLLRQIGAGGMGVVYEALDQQRNTRVALKTLRETDAHLLYRLKREFRSLRDLVHRNLVRLDELFAEGGHWFFTMELLEGEELHTYLRGAAGGPAARRDAASALWAGSTLPNGAAAAPPIAAGGPSATADTENGHERAPRAIDLDRVRGIFRQLAEGLIAVHDAGKIHRDIKPSNIIVTGGRAVILDFGLVTEHWGTTRSGEGEIVGTVMYMAPEQATAQAVGPAADWYSVGVMLYEALTGRRPFEGPWGGLFAVKQDARPRDPREVDAACPDDLAELCMRLMHSDPQRRPQGREVLSALGDGAGAEAASAPGAASAPPRRVFVGREGELRELRRAFDDVQAGASIAVFVYGESGIGKSTLLQCFASAVEAEDPGTVVLVGQCREHEAVPFKGVDGLIDALARHACRLSEVAAAELVPRHAALLPGVFPVLGRIPAIANAPRPSHLASDPFQQRKRVFTALREMLCRLTERSRLVCVIDDMQWIDSDSLHLLEELLQPPEQPRMLLLASVRSGEDAPPLPAVPGEVRRVRLPRLNSEESEQLAGMLLERIAPGQQLPMTRIIDETGGHPLFIGELVRYAAADHRAIERPLRLDEAIWARASQLEATSLRVLKLLATAVAPLSEEVIRSAAELDGSGLQESIALLRASYLIRGASATHGLLEVYHDRVRQSVVHHLGEAERAAMNARIAAALETSGEHVAPELLIHHLEGAGQPARAARKALEAADRAQAGLAFEQASQLYEVALRLAAWSAGERREILIKLGGALASAGRGPEAAAAYARAASGADPETQLACRIQVVDQLLQSGHLEQGAALLFELFQGYSHDVPDSQLQRTLRIIWYRGRLELRGLRWKERPRSEIAPRDLALLALYKAASRGLMMIDPVHAAYFVNRGLHLAMALGDRDFAMYFLLLESGFRSAEGSEQHGRFLAEADRVLTRHEDAQFQIIYRQTLGMRAYLSVDQEFRQAFEMLDRSDDALAQAANTAWELSAFRFFLISSLLKLGDFARIRAYSERFVREAEQRGNLYMRTTISRLRNILWLVDDEPERAREELKCDSWIPYSKGYHTQHWLELKALVEIAIYEGAPIDQLLISTHWKALRKSSIQRVLDYRCEIVWLEGRMALAEASRDPARRRVARRSAAKLRSYGTHHTRMLAGMLLATLAVQERKLEAAASGFREVAAMADAAHTVFLAAAARRRLGALVGGDEGRELVAAAERWMREAGIRNPERMTHLASPCELELGGRL